MRRRRAPAFLAAIAVVLSACGSGAKHGPITLAVPTATTVANARTGALVRCGSVGAHVPAPGHGVAAIGDPVPGASGAALQLERLRDGSLVVSCRR